MIDRIELYQVSLPFKIPFRTSRNVEENNNSIIVKVFYGGEYGTGESAVNILPRYIEETTHSVWGFQKEYLIPAIFRLRELFLEDLVSNLRRFKGNHFAFAGIESAILDLASKMDNRPLAEMLGGTMKTVAVGISLGMPSNIDHLLKLISDSLKKGYKRIKIKISPSWDVEPLKEIRKNFPKIKLQVDANESYRFIDLHRLKELDEFNLQMIEQPLAAFNLIDHKKLSKQLKTPICLDESVTSDEAADHIMSEEICQIINVKPGRVGGVIAARNIGGLALQKGTRAWIGGMLETGIGRAINVAVASCDGFYLPADISANERYFENDIVLNPFELNKDGTLTVPDRPGHGAVLDEDYLKKVTVRKEVFTKSGVY